MKRKITTSSQSINPNNDNGNKGKRTNHDDSNSLKTTTTSNGSSANAIKRKKKKVYINMDPDGTHDIAHNTFEINPQKQIKDDLQRLIKRSTVNTSSDSNSNNNSNNNNTNDIQNKIRQHMYGTSSIDLLQVRQDAISNYEQNENNTNDWNTIVQSYDSTPKQRSIAVRKLKKFNPIVQNKLQHIENKRYKASINAVYAEQLLQPSAITTSTSSTNTNYGMIEIENDMERTISLNQIQLKQHLLSTSSSQQNNNNNTNNDSNNPARHIYNIQLNESIGPYGLKYDRSGRYSCLYSTGSGGKLGHVAIMDNTEQTLQMEVKLPNDKIRDVTFLHNTTMIAVAQKQYIYIYDNNGNEIHCCNNHIDPMAITFLPYHYLLVSIGRAGYLKYQDTSTGVIINEHRTKLGLCSVLQQNKSNAIIHCGHTNGTVTLWSPNQSNYLVKLLCHPGGATITDIAIDQSGTTMITSGIDKQIKIWDLRMTYTYCHSYYTISNKIPTSIDISQRNMISIGHGGHVSIFNPTAITKKIKNPTYMEHIVNTLGGTAPVNTVQFRPYEDICGIGHLSGISSIVVPGSGEAALDTYEYNTNPYQDKKQRKEAEVRSLLDKLQPSMISLDTQQIGTIDVPDLYSKYKQIQAKRISSRSTTPAADITNKDDNDNDDDTDSDDGNIEDDNTKSKKRKIGKRRGKSKVQGQIRQHKQQYEKIVTKKIDNTNQYDTLLKEVFQQEEIKNNSNNNNNNGSKMNSIGTSSSSNILSKKNVMKKNNPSSATTMDGTNNKGQDVRKKRRRQRKSKQSQPASGTVTVATKKDNSPATTATIAPAKNKNDSSSFIRPMMTAATTGTTTTASATTATASILPTTTPSALKRFFT